MDYIHWCITSSGRALAAAQELGPAVGCNSGLTQQILGGGSSNNFGSNNNPINNILHSLFGK